MYLANALCEWKEEPEILGVQRRGSAEKSIYFFYTHFLQKKVNEIIKLVKKQMCGLQGETLRKA
jgi:hypothetical protein